MVILLGRNYATSYRTHELDRELRGLSAHSFYNLYIVDARLGVHDFEGKDGGGKKQVIPNIFCVFQFACCGFVLLCSLRFEGYCKASMDGGVGLVL